VGGIAVSPGGTKAASTERLVLKIALAIREWKTAHSDENFLCWYMLKTKDIGDAEK
jgi:hypothetical protein